MAALLLLLAIPFAVSQVTSNEALAQAQPTAVVTTPKLNVRSGPYWTYSVVTVIEQGEVVTLLGRNYYGTWAKIRLTNGVEGWVNVLHLYAEIDWMDLPLVTDGGARPTPTPLSPPSSAAAGAPAAPLSDYAAIVTTPRLNVRSGPYWTYSVVAVLNQGDMVTLLGRNYYGTWAKIRLADGVEGWVNVIYLYAEIEWMDLPLATASGTPASTSPTDGGGAATPAPAGPFPDGTAMVITGALNVRSGPGTEHRVITTLGEGEYVLLIGRNYDLSWAKVRLGNGVEGWVSTLFITVMEPPADLPILTE